MFSVESRVGVRLKKLEGKLLQPADASNDSYPIVTIAPDDTSTEPLLKKDSPGNHWFANQAWADGDRSELSEYPQPIILIHVVGRDCGRG